MTTDAFSVPNRPVRTNRIYRIGNCLHRNGFPRIARIFDGLNFFLRNSLIPSSCTIGEGTNFGHGAGVGVLIHSTAVIGKYCQLAPHILIGPKSGSQGAPVVEDYIFVGPGAKLLGHIRVGQHSIIGANAVVVKDVAPYSVVAGVPARVIARIDRSNFAAKYKDYFIVDDIFDDSDTYR